MTDRLTMHLPQELRNLVSAEILRSFDFEAKDLGLSKRAVLLNPRSEQAWATYCSVAAEDGRDPANALLACRQAESLVHYGGFDAGLITDAYARLHRPCDGLALMRLSSQDDKVNTSLMAEVAVLETNCGDTASAENRFRSALQLCQKDMSFWHDEDRPPRKGEPERSYEDMDRRRLSQARMNLSAELTLEGKDEEAFELCRAGVSRVAKRCMCKFTGQRLVDTSTCDAFPTE